MAEFGGNNQGYGSKSVLGSGWPKEVIRIEGDTVTLNFEMRSGREHNTPDQAVWGFRVCVRPHEEPVESSINKHFLGDIALTLIALESASLKVI